MHLWGAELRALRDRHGLSLSALGAAVFYDASHLGKFERGERIPPRHVAELCDQQLGGTGVLIRLWEAMQGAGADRDEANRGGHEANFRPELATVTEDPSPWGDGTVSLPVLHDGKVILVSVSRRVLLKFAGTAAGIAVAGVGPASAAAASTDHELAALAAQDGNPIEYLQQIRRVLIDNDNLLGPRVVIPTVEQQIRLMQALRSSVEGGDRRRLVQLQATYAEFAGWLHQDAGSFTAAQYWTDRALEWSHIGRDPDLTTFVLARKAQLAGDMGDPAEALDVGQAAEEAARPGTRLGAIAATYAAHGHALSQDETACAAAYDRARHLIDTTDVDPTVEWGTWLDHAYIDVHQARSTAVLGRHHQDDQPSAGGSDAGIRLMRQAAEGFATAIGRLPAGYHRDRGVYLARQAAAHTGAREPEQAAAVAMRALTVGRQTSSARILNELVEVDQHLTPWRSLPPVAAFHEALTTNAR
ncbi:helix-turn-helix domain-containing protein [Virgisporangium aurantiacum]|uniref:HTH cro/C1-type domain-containing protein n=1 Tax=Virgisporangium aurantiacum TaxID=175570 RepID=A0A8J3ZI63_9ACTN|nr:helix-turn-helix transcriptional regulator [Virgisporangium aurantiacum]GIJ64669.1 hypothetical protein Vau01_121850 [Virgisporangium aurantiacum]